MCAIICEGFVVCFFNVFVCLFVCFGGLQLCCILLFRLNHRLLFLITVSSIEFIVNNGFPREQYVYRIHSCSFVLFRFHEQIVHVTFFIYMLNNGKIFYLLSGKVFEQVFGRS